MPTTSLETASSLVACQRMFSDLHSQWEALKQTPIDSSLRKITLHEAYAYPDRTLRVGEPVVYQRGPEEFLATVVALRSLVFGMHYREVFVYCPEIQPVPFAVALEELR